VDRTLHSLGKEQAYGDGGAFWLLRNGGRVFRDPPVKEKAYHDPIQKINTESSTRLSEKKTKPDREEMATFIGKGKNLSYSKNGCGLRYL